MRVGVERAPFGRDDADAADQGRLITPLRLPLSCRTYDVSPDGQRFLMISRSGGTDQTAAPPQLIVVQHWTES